MIRRKLLQPLREHLSKPEITLIIGPRQAGKTTLMRLLQEDLQNESLKTIWFNLDIENDKQFFQSQLKLLQKIKLELGEKKGFVFIDEIQRKENAGVFLKGIYDMNLPYKFIVSGSGSLELKEKIHESLAGRKQIFVLPTISFEEFVDFKTQYRYTEKLSEFFEAEREKAHMLFEEYMRFGGYPRVILAENISEKNLVINEIYQSYVEKDIVYLLGVKKIEDFTHLVKLMASQVGNLVNISELSRTLGVSQKTIQNYLWYLQKTFLLHRVTPYFKNIRKEMNKTPIFYFSDLGLRNQALGIFGNTLDHPHHGFLFQNFVYQKLHEIFMGTSRHIHFWRTRSGAEVDFVIDAGKTGIPIEVKYQKLVKQKLSRSLKSFLTQYQPPYALFINRSLETTVLFEQTKILFMPYYGTLVENMAEVTLQI